MKTVVKKVKTKDIYICDRCGKELEDIYCHINVHPPYDFSVSGTEYHFCEECYKEIYDTMTNKDQKHYTREIVYYPVYSPNREWQWGPNYPVTYTTTTKRAKEGFFISSNKINCIDNSVARVCIQGNYY